LRDIEKLVGLKLPKEKNIGLNQILMLPKNQSNKDKKTATIQLREKKPKTHYKPKQQ
jgi:hypothetical protein